MTGADEITIRLAESRDELALWLMLTFAASMGDGGPARIDEAKFDLPEFRDRWIGGRLLDALLITSRSGVRSVALSVRADNPAVRLYRRIGFKEVGRTENRVGGSSLVMRYEMGERPPG